jgi:methylenetetrahydrofolate reductase (NADPH)
MELSIEFFPPKTADGFEKLTKTRELLNTKLKPAFYSVTYGAGGSTQSGTLQTVCAIHNSGQAVAPHLSCVGTSREQVGELLKYFKELGIKRMVALRGDLPSGMGQYGEFHHANELVEFIREKTGDWFHIEVAAYPEVHPQAKSPEKDVDFFVQKVRAGANSAITQYFFNCDSYFRFVDDVKSKGIDVPIVPGIMPITSSAQLLRFSDACGAEVPRWVRMRLQAYGDDTASIKLFGEEVVTSLCEKLINANVPGLHFYCLNQAEPVLRVTKNLSLIDLA